MLGAYAIKRVFAGAHLSTPVKFRKKWTTSYILCLDGQLWTSSLLETTAPSYIRDKDSMLDHYIGMKNEHHSLNLQKSVRILTTSFRTLKPDFCISKYLSEFFFLKLSTQLLPKYMSTISSRAQLRPATPIRLCSKSRTAKMSTKTEQNMKGSKSFFSHQAL